MTIVGTRPEIIKLSEIIKQADRNFEHIIVHTGQNYDYTLNQVFFDELGLRNPDYYLGVVGEDLGETIGNIINKSYKLLKEIHPDALLVLGDTNSCLSVISAKRLKIPIFHLEAGNRCFDENLPEEVNRRIVDHVSDINICYSENARGYLSFEGVAKEFTFVSGSPMKEVILRNIDKIDSSDILDRLSLLPQKYFLLSAHREENIDNQDNFYELMNSINYIAKHYDIPIVYSIHPRSKKYIEDRNFQFEKNVIKVKPLGYIDYVRLQKSAYCVISDSGTLAEEASILRFPAVSLRTSTERPEALDKGNFIIGNLNHENIIQSISIVVESSKNEKLFASVPAYEDINVSFKIVNLIQSFTSIVNMKVWHKSKG